MANRVHLTTDRIRKLVTPEGKQPSYTFDDAPKHLCVRVTPAGVKSFVFASKLKGVPIRITIGSPDVWALDKARERAKHLQSLIDQGIDPREVERERIKAQDAAAQVIENRKKYTLHALCDAYVAYLVSKNKIKSGRDTKSIFKVHVIEAWPDYAALPAQEVTSHQIAAIIRKVRELEKERTAGILRNYLTAAYNAARRAPFDSAMPSSLIAFEITSNPAEIVPTIPVKRGNRVLSTEELKQYMAGIGEDAAGQALYIALLTGGQRIAQLVRAKASDFDPDTDTLRLWDTKGKRAHPREHLLPLGSKAASIIKEIVLKVSDTDNLIFSVKGQVIGIRVSEISKKIGGEPFDLRDIRRTVETQLAGMGIHKDIRAQLLSHGISGVQAAHYDRYEYMTEKKNALLAWEARLDEITHGTKNSNVINIGKVA